MALMSEPVTSLQDDTRKQLGAFLRARRESLDPQRLGLPRSGRRRTPGLRREEVAMLADVGVTWYTWLEQGRDVNPSSAVMAAIAKALQCTPTEARHLFVLAGLPPGEAPQAVCCEGISEGTRRLLDTLMPKPASIQKPNFDIVAWNDSFGHLMGVDFNAIPPEDRNCIFCSSPIRRGARGSANVTTCCRFSSPTSARPWLSTVATRSGKRSWRVFLRCPKSSKPCGTSVTTCAAWRTSSSCLPIPSWGIFISSRCTGTLRRETDRGCWSIYPWMRQGRGRWRGWRSRGSKCFARGFEGINADPVLPGISW